MTHYPRRVYNYIGILILLAIGLWAALAWQYQPSGGTFHWLLVCAFFLLTALSNRYSIRLGAHLHLQVNTIPVFASILLFQPFEVALLTATATILFTEQRKIDWGVRIFNTAQTLLYAGAASLVLSWFTSVPWQPGEASSWLGLVLSIVILLFGNLLLVAGIISLQNRTPFLTLARQMLIAQVSENLVMVALGWLTALVVNPYPWALLLLVAPAVMIFRIVGRIYRTEADLRQHQAELEAIVSVSAALRTSTSRMEIIAVVLKKITERLSSTGSLLAMYDPFDETLQVEQASGSWKNLAGKHVSLQEGAVRAALFSGQIFQGSLADCALNSVFPQQGSLQGSLLFAPLRVKELVIGVLGVVRQPVFQQEDVRLLSASADIAANAIHRTTLTESNQRHLHQLNRVSRLGETLSETLSETQIAGLLAQSLQTLFEHLEVILVFLLDDGGEQLNCAFVSLSGQVLLTHQVHSIDHQQASAPVSTVLRTHHTYQPANPAEKTSFWEQIFPGQPAPPDCQSTLIAPLVAREEVVGFVWLACSLRTAFQQSDEEMVSLAGSIAAVTLQNARLFGSLHTKNVELTTAYDTTLIGLAKALELRDRDTGDHCERVASLTLQLAAAMNVPDEQLPHIRRGAYLHDIGKIGIPDAILYKNGPLSPDEWQIMYSYPILAYELIQDIPYLEPAKDIPYYHHEKWDGSGYPSGLIGEQIPIAARIFAVVDVWDALNSDRPYRPAWERQRILDYICEQKGRHFDPAVVDAFLKLLDRQFACF